MKGYIHCYEDTHNARNLTSVSILHLWFVLYLYPVLLSSGAGQIIWSYLTGSIGYVTEINWIMQGLNCVNNDHKRYLPTAWPSTGWNLHVTLLWFKSFVNPRPKSVKLSLLSVQSCLITFLISMHVLFITCK